MCPMLIIVPVLFVSGLLYGFNWLLRRRKLLPGNKSVFITGCDRGFGETLSVQLSLEGYRVYSGCLDVNSAGANHLRSLPGVTVVQVDITDQSSVDKAALYLQEQLWDNGLWAVVNNAGVAVFAETEWCSMAAYEKVVGVNLLGTIRVTKACLPLVRKAAGRVVNISSLAGRCALPGFTAYSASKYAIIGFSDSLRREMWKFGVKVITIEPKLYRTAIADGDFHVQTNQQMWAETSDSVKMDYGDTYFSAFLEKMLINLRMSSRRTYQVIDDLLHATTAAYPYTRYVPGLKMSLMSGGFIVQPNCVQDYCINKKLGVQCVPFSRRTKKSV